MGWICRGLIRRCADGRRSASMAAASVRQGRRWPVPTAAAGQQGRIAASPAAWSAPAAGGCSEWRRRRQSAVALSGPGRGRSWRCAGAAGLASACCWRCRPCSRPRCRKEDASRWSRAPTPSGRHHSPEVGTRWCAQTPQCCAHPLTGVIPKASHPGILAPSFDSDRTDGKQQPRGQSCLHEHAAAA